MATTPLFSWNPEEGVASCILTDGKNYFTGSAFCAEIDKDMISEKTGCQIALWRAEISYYTHVRDNEIIPALNALKQLYYSINRSKKFNEDSYENKMLQRQIRLKEIELDTVKDLLIDKKKKLKSYIAEKDMFYKRIRANRKTELVGQN